MRKTFSQSLALASTSAIAAWFAYAAVCLAWPYSLLCRQPGGDLIAVAATIAAVLLWITSHQRERLRRRLRRGMYSRVSSGAATFGRQVKHIFGDEAREVEVWRLTGWWVETPIGDGTRVWVGADDMWEWLIEINAMNLTIKRGASPIARALWEPIIGKLQWDARARLLLAVGAAGYNTDDARSRRLIRSDVGGIMSDLEGLGSYGEN